MPKIIFGLSNENIDPSEYRDGVAASVRDCYQVTVGNEQHFRKRKGLLELGDSGSAATQGEYETFSGIVVTVSGGVVSELKSDGTLIQYTGDALNSGTQCIFAEDFSNVFIAHGGKLAKLDTVARTVTLLGGNSPDNVTHVAYSQGYLLCNGLVDGGVAGDTNYSDDVSNGYTASNSWELFNNERLPDGCNAVITGWDAEVYSFGPNSVEVSYNDGTTPWSVLQGAYMQYGLLAPNSALLVDNTMFWLTEADGARRIVRMVERAPVVISSPYDQLLNKLSTVSDARAWIQQIDGYSFYVITFPAADKTFAYKIDDGTWSEFGFWNVSTASYESYKAHNARYIRAWNKVILGDRENGKFYTQSGLSDNGEPVRFEITSGQMESGTLQTKRERWLLFRVKRGYEEGGTYQYRIRDDHKQWKNEKNISLGELGETKPYTKVTSGGTFRSRQYQITHSDTDTDFIFMGLENKIEKTGR